jgi:RNA polymerase sigma factor (sigma-70 family)
VPESSFEEFVRAALPVLTRYARALTGNVHAADDLVQSTLVKVAGAWRRIRADGNPLGYARTALFRTFVSWHRLRSWRDAPLELFDRPAPEPGYDSVDARIMLREAMAALPRLQRAVLVATYLDDEPDDVIADLIGRTPSTVRSLRRRGLIAVRAALGVTPTSTSAPAAVAARQP